MTLLYKSFNVLLSYVRITPTLVGNSDQNNTKIMDIFWSTDLYGKWRLVKNLLIQENKFIFLIGYFRIAPRDHPSDTKCEQ